MANPPPGFVLDDVAPPPGFVLDKPRSFGREVADTAITTGSGLMQGLREGLNPLHIAAGLATLGQASVPLMLPGVQEANRVLGTENVVKDFANWAVRNSSITDPVNAFRGTPNGQAAEALLKNHGMTLDDIHDPNKMATIRGAEMTTLRRYLAATARGVGQAAPFVAIPGAGVAATLGTGAVSGAGGELGEDIAGPEGRMVGSILPTILTGAAAAIVPGGAAARVANATNLGVPLSAGQATGSKFLQGIESLVSSWGGVGVMARFGERQAAQAGASAERQAARFSPAMEDEMAGRRVVASIESPMGFVDRTERTAQRLYARRDAAVPPDTPIVPANTLNFLTQRTAVDPLAPNLTRTLNTQAAQRLDPIQQALIDDMRLNGGNIPFRAIVAARSRVGEQIENSILSGTAPQREARALYATMSEDIRTNLTGPALQAQVAADRFWDARLTHIESVIQPIINAKAPENIIAALNRNSSQGGSIIRQTMGSVAPGDRGIISGALFRRLGTATPGQQNAAGEIFSPATFVTRWNKMDDSAKRALFDVPGGQAARMALDQFAETMGAIKSGTKTLANYSGTAARAFHLGQWFGLGPGSVLGSIMQNEPQIAAGVVGSMMGGNAIARLMTNQRFTRWLANSGDMSPGAWMQQGEALSQNNPEFQTFIRAISSQPPSQSSPPPRQ